MLSALFKYAPVQAAASLSVFCLISLQANLLNIETYGLLAIIMVILELARSASSQWISNALVRLYPQALSNEKIQLEETSLAIVWLLLIPAAGLICIILLGYTESYRDIWPWASALLIAKSLYTYSVEICRLRENLGVYRGAVISQAALSVFVTGGLLAFYPTAQGALGALAISYAIPWLFFLRTLPRTCNGEVAQKIFVYGFPLLLAGCISMLGSKLDRIFIAEYADLASLGGYSGISNMIIGITTLVFTLVSLPTYPELAKSAGDRKSLEKQHAHYLDLLTTTTLPALLGLCIVADPLIRVLLTEEYLQVGIEIYWIIGVAAYLMNLKAHYIDHGLQFLLKTKYLPLLSVVSLATNTIILMLLISRFGTYGAAWAWLLTNAISLAITYTLSRRLGYKYKPGPNLGKIIISASSMAFILIFILHLTPTLGHANRLFILTVSGISIYAFFLVALDAYGLRKKLLTRKKSNFAQQ